jgi:hypothetical protein
MENDEAQEILALGLVHGFLGFIADFSAQFQQFDLTRHPGAVAVRRPMRTSHCG